MKNKLYIIGVTDQQFSEKEYHILTRCRHVFGAKRFAALIPDGCALHPITPLAMQIEKMAQLLEEAEIAVLASGDPLYYGIARTLLRHFSTEQLHIIPALSSIQHAAALFRLPWDDARLLSLHGRKAHHLPGLFLAQKKSITLTDDIYTPNRIAKEILHYLEIIDSVGERHRWQVYVAEDIGTAKEKLFSGSLTECAATTFSSLNVFALQRQSEASRPPFTFGLKEDDIRHSRGLITKNEVRAATLHTLSLPEKGIFWDIGAGSGSISIEAARLNPELVIYAVEHKEEELSNIKANIRRFHCYNIIPVAGHAPEILAELPSPNRIFVGGSSGTLPDIVEQASKRLTSNGRIVINGVIKKTVDAAPKLLEQHGFFWESSKLAVERANSAQQEWQFNPITIFTGEKLVDANS